MISEGSHGLDLSFVTHIFLMDTVFDESLEQQVFLYFLFDNIVMILFFSYSYNGLMWHGCIGG